MLNGKIGYREKLLQQIGFFADPFIDPFENTCYEIFKFNSQNSKVWTVEKLLSKMIDKSDQSYKEKLSQLVTKQWIFIFGDLGVGKSTIRKFYEEQFKDGIDDIAFSRHLDESLLDIKKDWCADEYLKKCEPPIRLEPGNNREKTKAYIYVDGIENALRRKNGENDYADLYKDSAQYLQHYVNKRKDLYDKGVKVIFFLEKGTWAEISYDDKVSCSFELVWDATKIEYLLESRYESCYETKLGQPNHILYLPVEDAFKYISQSIHPILPKIALELIYLKSTQFLYEQASRRLEKYIDAKRFREQFIEKFNIDELEILCFDLQIEFENISGETKAKKCIGIYDYCKRNDCLPKLFSALKHHRPEKVWEVK